MVELVIVVDEALILGWWTEVGAQHVPILIHVECVINWHIE